MHILFDIVLPVFSLVLMGYGAARLRWFPVHAVGGLTAFMFNFAVPILLFHTLATTKLPAEIPWKLFGSYYLSMLVIFALGAMVAVVLSRRSLEAAAIIGFTAGFSNTVLFGIPIILTALGPEASVPLFLLISVHSPTGFTLLIIAMELLNKKGGGLKRLPLAIGRSIITNPILIGVAAGLLINLLGIPLPRLVDATARLMTGAVSPVSLFALGATMTQYRIAGRLSESLSLVALKTLIFPGVVFVMATYVFELDTLWRNTAVLLAAVPTGVNAFLFADRYGVGKASATTTIFLGTGLSVATLSLILYLLHVGPGL